MFGAIKKQSSEMGLVADVGRTKLRVGLTGEDGRLDSSSVREYDAAGQPTISTALSTFGAQAGLTGLPRRAAIAVSGVPRGDTISITNSRWILSRPGLAAMFQSTPLILNDFAANAWAFSSEHTQRHIEPISAGLLDLQRPGTYCIVGVGSGLGVALMHRDAQGFVTVLPTEGGHMGLMDGLAEIREIAGRLRRGSAPIPAEAVISGPGLVNIHRHVCEAHRKPAVEKDLRDLLRSSSARADPLVAEATELFVKAFWHFAGNLVLAYGAWDGVIVTGSVTAALRPLLNRADLSKSFAIEGPYARRLRDVPTAWASYKNAELEGAAVALMMEDKRSGFSNASDRFVA